MVNDDIKKTVLQELILKSTENLHKYMDTDNAGRFEWVAGYIQAHNDWLEIVDKISKELENK